MKIEIKHNLKVEAAKSFMGKSRAMMMSAMGKSNNYFTSLTDEQQDSYLDEHPMSKYASAMMMSAMGKRPSDYHPSDDYDDAPSGPKMMGSMSMNRRKGGYIEEDEQTREEDSYQDRPMAMAMRRGKGRPPRVLAKIQNLKDQIKDLQDQLAEIE